MAWAGRLIGGRLLFVWWDVPEEPLCWRVALGAAGLGRVGPFLEPPKKNIKHPTVINTAEYFIEY